jgi:thiol-disulfide isomerase/thioredoxin
MKEIVDNDISVLKEKTCYLLLYFTASWCGPCQRIKPLLYKLSEGFKEEILEIYMVDIDANEELSGELQVKSVPTFYLFKGKELQGQCTGSDITKVHALLKEHLG